MAEAGHGGPGTAEGLCLAISLKKTMQKKAPCMCTATHNTRSAYVCPSKVSIFEGRERDSPLRCGAFTECHQTRIVLF